MIVFPWYIRMAIDCVIIATPFYYLHNHRTTHLFEYFQHKRQQKRRLSFQQMNDKISTDPHISIQQTKKFYAELGIKM